MNRKISRAQVRAIRLGYDAGIAQSVLAERYGISATMIYRICKGERYKDVDPPSSKTLGPVHNQPQGRPSGTKKITDAEIARMRRMKQQGYSYRELSKVFSCSTTTCFRYCKEE